MHWTKKFSGVLFATLTLLLLLGSGALSAKLAEITAVHVKAAADRDLVVFETSHKIPAPQTALKLYPTRLEVTFTDTNLKAVNPKVKGTTLVRNVLVAGDTDTVVAVVYLDVKGKVPPESYRWSSPGSGLLVLEVFYPLSDRSELTLAMLEGMEPAEVPAPEAAPEAPTAPAAPEEPAVEAPAAPPAALPRAAHALDLVYFNAEARTLTVRSDDPLECEIYTDKFPPSLVLEFGDAALTPTVGPIVAGSLGAIRVIEASSWEDAGKVRSRIRVTFLNSRNLVYEDSLSADGKTLTVWFPEAESVILPEVEEAPAPEIPEPVAPSLPEEAMPESALAPPSAPPTVGEFPSVEGVPAAEAPGFEPAPTGDVVDYVDYDSSASTLTIRATAEATVNVVPVRFPRGYNIIVDLPPTREVTDYIFKFDSNVRYLSVAEVPGVDSGLTRIMMTLDNASELVCTSPSTLHGESVEIRFAPAAARPPEPSPPAPLLEPGRNLAGELPQQEPGSTALATVDDVFAQEVESDSDYPRMPVGGVPEGEYELPEFPGAGERLSDVLVNLPAPTGLSVYQVLNLMSQLAGISIILDPYITDPPIGGVANRRVLEPLQFGGAGSPIGFREAAQFNALITEPGTVIGNFENVPWDTALDIILETHQFKKVIYRDPSDPYAKPVILVTSRERKEQEIKGANVIDFYQLNYADPTEVYGILYNLDLLPSIQVGWYVYRGYGGGYGGGGGGYGGGGGGAGGGGYGGGGRGGRGYSAQAPDGTYLDASTATASAYFQGELLQGGGGIGGGIGGGGGGAGGGGRVGGGGGAGGAGGGGYGGMGGGGIPLPTAKSGLIVMRGTRETLDVVQSIIRKIDKPPKQASIGITVYQVTENPRAVFGMLSAGAERDRLNFTYSNGGGTLVIAPKYGIMLPQNYDAIFEALLTERKAKVTTQSEVSVIDGFQASLTVDRSRGNFRQTVSFDQNGNAIRTSTFDEVTVGTDIVFTPQIDDVGRVTLYVTVDISNFDGPPQVSPDGLATFQPTTETSMDTYFRLADGQTAMIGGLQTKQFSDEVFGVPFLSDLPFIGTFFQHHDRSEDNSYVFITLTVHLVSDR